MAHLTKVKISNNNWDNSDSDLIVVGVYEDKTFSSIAKSINEQNDKLFENAIDIGDIKGKRVSFIFFILKINEYF